MNTKAHWQAVFKSNLANEVSWYQPHLRLSMELVARAGISTKAKVIDVGGGDSTLVDDLLGQDLEDVTVLDLSSEALARAKQRLGAMAARVKWIEADITKVQLPLSYYDVWHDRAVFHFLTNPEDRGAYSKLLSRALRPFGHVIIATFAADGPQQCSGLPTMRYNPEELQKELGSFYELIASEPETHWTPSRTEQRFVYCLLRKRGNIDSA